MDPPKRRASRLVVVDRDGRILLFQYEDNRGKWWATPGGGVQPGETFEDAATREAEEELGLRPTSLEPLWERIVRFESRGALVQQTERYFLLRTTAGDVLLDDDVREAHTVEGIIAARWWLPREINSTDERIFPEDLVMRLGGVLV
jgi:8-oxo-dGTP pyrophosphatase MutT (NUDIX family)